MRLISPFFELVSKALWGRLRRRSNCEVKVLPGLSNLRGSRSSIVCGRYICYESSQMFDVIILDLTTKHGWNFPDLGILDATSSFRVNDD
jgi:hypothetical protein